MTARRLRAVLVAATLALAGCSGAGGAPSTSDGTGAAGPAAAAEPGTKTLAFSGDTVDGSSLDVSTLTGEPVVLWFWTPWCTICRSEAPDIAEIAAEYRDDATFIGVAGGGELEEMQAFVRETGTGDLQHLVDADGSLWRRFGVVAQPAFVFVLPDGTTDEFLGAMDAQHLRETVASLAGG